MPLLDHFHPPLSRTHPWRAFHGAWAAAIARLLNAGVLPSGYYAVPFLDRDGPMEIDVAALNQEQHQATTDGPVSNVAWAPAAPQLAVPVEWPSVDDISVDIFSDDGDPLLAAAIELVSPANKARPGAREAFTAKCAGLLRHGRGLVVVDAVTTRRTNLHADLLEALDATSTAPEPGPLAAISYKAVAHHEGGGQLLAWTGNLAVGQPLPTVPLWLTADLSVPLDLESSHAAACTDLRISAYPRLA